MTTIPDISEAPPRHRPPDDLSRFAWLSIAAAAVTILLKTLGAPLSLYGLKLSYNKNIGRKGIFSVTNDDYEFWKSFRGRIEGNSFVDYEAERNEALEKAREEYNKQINAEHENILERLSCEELPY